MIRCDVDVAIVANAARFTQRWRRMICSFRETIPMETRRSSQAGKWILCLGTRPTRSRSRGIDRTVFILRRAGARLWLRHYCTASLACSPPPGWDSCRAASRAGYIARMPPAMCDVIHRTSEWQKPRSQQPLRAELPKSAGTAVLCCNANESSCDRRSHRISRVLELAWHSLYMDGNN